MLILKEYKHSIESCVDCHTLHMKDIVNTFKIPLSGPLCFGLSEAYDFQYWMEESCKIPYLVMLGRKVDVFEKFFNKFDIKTKYATIKDKELFKNRVYSTISRNNVLLTYVDRYYLNYINEKLSRSHFGIHMVAIIGVRENDNICEYGAADFTSNNIFWINEDNLSIARNSNWHPFPPQNKCIEVTLSSLNSSIDNNYISELIISSLHNTSLSMLEGSKNGINAMNSLSKELNNLLNNDINKYERALKFQLKLIQSYIMQFEQTHSFYRKIYAMFLEECIKKYFFNELQEPYKQISYIANKWENLACNITSTGNVRDIIMGLCKEIKEISKLEGELFANIALFTNSICHPIK